MYLTNEKILEYFKSSKEIEEKNISWFLYDRNIDSLKKCSTAMIINFSTIFSSQMFKEREKSILNIGTTQNEIFVFLKPFTTHLEK
jgi:hypothetical protein